VMRNPNELPIANEWVLPDRCRCSCLCAVIANWDGDKRRGCGCCTGSCGHCVHGVEGPGLWAGDQA
jgi:hypothetical protein